MNMPSIFNILNVQERRRCEKEYEILEESYKTLSKECNLLNKRYNELWSENKELRRLITSFQMKHGVSLKKFLKYSDEIKTKNINKELTNLTDGE